MASLSLPRVLQQRKSSLEIERENFEKCQATAISKAVNHLETPLKQKHVRSTIIGTFHEKGAQTFWIVALRLPLQEDRIVAWKFCHVLHKLLREGYPTTIQHSQRHKGELENLGKLWVHLKDCYGKLIHLYCSLLMTKLDFHRRNPRFPGNLSVTHSELESIGENDINNYFQMSVEMFDYMDNILELQTAIFGSIDRSRSNSMTSCGQCKLSPLIPCIQDASRLYDFCVKILFKLHSALPSDTLSGHRDRFLKQFRELKMFYQNSNALQYFRNLITIPSLPENPPNFLIQAELRTYVTPVVIIPPEEPDTESVSEATLIDTSLSPNTPDTVDSNITGQNGHSGQQLMELISERDGLIDHLQQENQHLRQETQKLAKDYQKQVNNLQEQITAVETELATRESELVQERQLKEDLFQQATQTAQNQDSEHKLKEEKFTKLKDVYTKLREEHIQLIRQKADVEKKLLQASKQVHEVEKCKNELNFKVHELELERSVHQEQIQQSAQENNLEVQNLRKEHNTLISENSLLNSKVERLTDEKSLLERALDDVQQEKLQLESKISEMSTHIITLTTNNEKLQNTLQLTLDHLLSSLLKYSSNLLQNEDHPLVSSSIDYFLALSTSVTNTLQTLLSIIQSPSAPPGHLSDLSITICSLGHFLSIFLDHGRAVSSTLEDISKAEELLEEVKELGKGGVEILEKIKRKEKIDNDVNMCLGKVEKMVKMTQNLKNGNEEKIVDNLENELLMMDKNIEEAARQIQEMLKKSREADSGIKLEVNEKILDSCTKLMQAIRLLVQKSRVLQAEIVSQGKGSSSVKEFYKRNHRWTDGLISAAKAVGTAAGFLLTAADKVTRSEAQLEHVAVAAQEIAASTAQLVVASRVKAQRNSSGLQELSSASKQVTAATGAVVATAKDCALMMDEQDDFDTTKLTLHAAKRLEMDTQIRVLELEKELEQNRTKLLALRRHHYQLAGESEGWDTLSDLQQ